MNYLRLIFLLAILAPIASIAQSVAPAASSENVSSMSAAEKLNEDAVRSKSSRKSLKPFGANLFKGGFSTEKISSVNPEYVVAPGDQISLSIWGAFEYSSLVTVDPQGNILIPGGVGPVNVGGTKNANLNDKVTASVRTVFTDDVKVYTSLVGNQPVSVFVTGYVINPGSYAGIPSNSVLYFLDRAKGIDALKGSYRDIKVMRDGNVIANVDLYSFLVKGEVANIQFRDGDTLVVGSKGSSVQVAGDVNNPAQFEFNENTIDGRDLYATVLPEPGVSFVGISGVREGKPFSVYLPIEKFYAFKLYDGDLLNFATDYHEEVIVVEIEGSFNGPSKFAVPKNTRLPQLLDYIEVDRELSDIGAISIKRRSIAERQKASLESSLQRLESRYLTASSQTDAEASIRAQEAKMISEFVARARLVEPNGRLVVSKKGQVANVVLQNGDTITIPGKSDAIILSGEILVAQAILYDQAFAARDYISSSGGFSDQADKKRIVLVHANGEVTTSADPTVRPGDEIIVLPKVRVKNLQIASVIVDILYKVAVAASVAVQL